VAVVDAATGAVRYFHTDRLGSVVALSAANDATAATGAVTDSYAYSAFGESAAAPTGNPWRYTGRYLDAETGLYYYRARYYSPRLGRFLETDPMGTKDDPNLYMYVGLDPLNSVDPMGERNERLYQKALARASGRYVASVVVTQLDTPAPGPADVVGVGMAILTSMAAGYDIGKALLSEPDAPADADSDQQRTERASSATGRDPTARRVTPRKATRQAIDASQPRDADGNMVDPNSGDPLNPGEIDVGHKPDEEWRRRQQMHREQGSTRQEVIEAENDPGIYQLEDRGSNRSRKHEQK
jgi:RHS repeat-associated protein